MSDYNIPGLANDTFILIKNNKIYLRSDAALEIARNLDAMWKIFFGLKIVPKIIRDSLYNQIARNRYKLFGRRRECMLPTKELMDRFITEG